MSRRGQWLALFAVAGAILLGIVTLFRLRLARGDGYPVYSTLRSDPLGARALYESLQALPELRVARSLKPLENYRTAAPVTLILAGMDEAAWKDMTPGAFNRLDSAVRGGSRLVLTFRAGFERPQDAGDGDEAGKPVRPEQPAPQKKKDGPGPRPPREPRRIDAEEPAPAAGGQQVDWKRLWGVELKRRWLRTRDDSGAWRRNDAPRTLPSELSWKSDLHFGLEQGAPWRVLYTRATEPVLVEMPHGRGSIVLAADSFFLSNEALQRERATGLLAWMIGPNTRVVFDETHLGVAEDPGVAALARRYGLAWAFFTAVLLAVLFVWRRMALFVPPAPPPETLAPGHQPTAGIEALLRRAVPAGRLASVCLAEWRKSARPADHDRVASAVSGAARPGDAYNRAVRALKRK